MFYFLALLAMFAYVRLRDNKKVVMPVSDIKKFKPKGLNDYDGAEWHDVFWDDDTDCGYYLAQVVKLFGKSSFTQFCLHSQLERSCRFIRLFWNCL